MRVRSSMSVMASELKGSKSCGWLDLFAGLVCFVKVKQDGLLFIEC